MLIGFRMLKTVRQDCIKLGFFDFHFFIGSIESLIHILLQRGDI